MTHRRRVLVAAGLVLTACTTSHPGSGRSTELSEASSTPVTSTPVTSTPSSSTPASSRSVSTPFPPAGLARVPAHSAIGDPVTADLCAAAGLAAFQDLPGVPSPSFDPEQYPPGCSITLRNGEEPLLTVSVFAAQHRPREADGRTQTRSHGLTVYGFPFDPSIGSCERDVAAENVLLVADTLARGSTKAGSELACAAADAMAGQMAAAAASGSVDRLALADPSVTELDACSAARRSGITSLGTYGKATFKRRGFDANCEVRSGDAFLFINVGLVDTTRAAPGDSITVDGHDLLQMSMQPRFCSCASPQGSATDGVQEQVTASATAPDAAKPPGDLCPDTAAALARYLTAAGLP